ncbi:MAG: hypothetical protein ABW156_05045 [Jiangellaceae bacterium]
MGIGLAIPLGVTIELVGRRGAGLDEVADEPAPGVGGMPARHSACGLINSRADCVEREQPGRRVSTQSLDRVEFEHLGGLKSTR